MSWTKTCFDPPTFYSSQPLLLDPLQPLPRLRAVVNMLSNRLQCLESTESSDLLGRWRPIARYCALPNGLDWGLSHLLQRMNLRDSCGRADFLHRTNVPTL